MDQVEFLLELSGDRSGYRIRAASPYRDPITAEFVAPWDADVLSDRLYRVETAVLRGSGRRRSKGAVEEQVVRDFGKELFDLVFPDEIKNAFYEAVDKARATGKILRLKLEAGPSELANLPWEFLYDERTPDFIALSTTTPLVRHLNVGKATPRLKVTAPLRILGMTCSPSNMQRLDSEGEKQRINDAIRPLVDQGLIEMVWIEGQTWRDLQVALEEDDWHIFHFIGHGHFDDKADEGTLALADDNGLLYSLDSRQLARLIGDETSLRLVVLNACEGARGDDSKPFSSMAATLVQRGIPAVLAMQYEVSDDAAKEFSRKLYGSLAAGRPLDVSVADARLAVSFEVNDSLEWATPVLIMRAHEGALFDVERPAEDANAETLTDPPGAIETVPIAGIPEPARSGASMSTPDPNNSGSHQSDVPADAVVPLAAVTADSLSPPSSRSEVTKRSSSGLWKGVAIGGGVIVALFIGVLWFFSGGSCESGNSDFVAGEEAIVVTESDITGEFKRGECSAVYEYQPPDGVALVDVGVLPVGDLDLILTVRDASNQTLESDDQDGVGGAGREELRDVMVPSDGSLFVKVTEFDPNDANNGAYTLTFRPHE